jgi:hypothetical protein
MDSVKPEPYSDNEVYQHPISFEENFEFMDMRNSPSVWKEVKVSYS